MNQLVYASTASVPFSAEALRMLLTKARERNTALDVSGMLLHVNGSFLQVLEGEPAALATLFDRISADPRHAHVLTLLRREIEARNFPDWSMGFFDASKRASSLLGYRATAGFADLVGDTSNILRVVADFRDGRWRSLAA